MRDKDKLVLEKYLPRSKTVRMRILWGYDMAMIWTCTCLALGLRFDLNLSSAPVEYVREVWEYGFSQMVVVSPVSCAGYLYAIMWGVLDTRKVVQILLVCLAAALAQSVGILSLDARMSRSYYMLRFVLMAGAVISGWVSFQAFQKIMDKINRLPKKNIPLRVVIIGMRGAGILILEEMKTNEKVYGYPVCIIDDDRDKRGRVIDGISIVGSRRDIAKPVREKGINEIYMATPTAPPEGIRDIPKTCQGIGCQVKIPPDVHQLMSGEVTISRLRKAKIEDSLEKEPVSVNLDEIMGYVKGKVVLVTGGGGPIDGKLCRQLTLHGVKQPIIFDIYESNAYETQQKLRRKYSCLDLMASIGSARNTSRFDHFFRIYRPDIAYHATAHKHMPLMEDSPNEVIKNNTLSAYKTAGVAIKYKVRRFILVSTDKIVNPANIMGISKRPCEMMV